jgi:ABC-2 type transport system permease protein
MTYAVSAMNALGAGDPVAGDLLVIAGFAVAALGLGAVTLRRRTA